jgi:hypothetical protein
VTSRERLRAAWAGRSADHVPLTTWCFGLQSPPELRWERDGAPVDYWYSLRMEHIHTLPRPWTLADDFARVLAWRRWGVDDILDVSVPWSAAPGVTFADTTEPAPGSAEPVMARTYRTLAGPARHAVRRTGEDVSPGWVVQPDHVPLFEDFNIPRAVRHLVTVPADVEVVRHLYAPPDGRARGWLAERLAKVGEFAAREGVAVQAWSAFGMDAVVWLCGTEGAVLFALDHPDAFERLVADITATDVARTALAASSPAVDLLVGRGWYSSTDFWSPELFDRFVAPHLRAVSAAAHAAGKPFAYVMTTGVETLVGRLVECGVDVLYFVDPVQDRADMAAVRDAVAGAMTLVGGTNALSLAGDPSAIDGEVARALDALGPTRRFVLHPVDALFPDTPHAGLERLVRAWERYR